MANERRMKGYAALVATFLLGAATGAGVSYASVQRHYAHLFRERPNMLEQRRLGALARRLDLDEQQQQRIRTIVEKYVQERHRLTREMFEQCGQKVRAAQDALDTDVEKVLRPDQVPRYESLAKERRERFGFGRH